MSEIKESDSSDDNIDNMVSHFVGSQRITLDDLDRKIYLEQLERDRLESRKRQPEPPVMYN